MKIVYKLTTQDMKTRKGCSNEVTWVPGKWVKATGPLMSGLCSCAYVHYYDHPLLAILLNPIHANIKNPRLWEAEIAGRTISDRGLKSGARKLRLLRELEVPTITTEQRIRFAIRCVMGVYQEPSWTRWATNWLSKKDRSPQAAATAARAAARAASYAADAAAYATARVAADAAHADAYAADAAAYAAHAAYTAARAAYTTAHAADMAAHAADIASPLETHSDGSDIGTTTCGSLKIHSNESDIGTTCRGTLDLIAIAEEACKCP